MSVVPISPKVAKIEFYENHIAPWTANAVVIGTAVATVADLQTKTEAAREAYAEQQVAKQQAEIKTEALKNAMNAMKSAGAGILDQIRGKAKNTGDPNVYVLAEIPAPATPTPVGAPGTPSNLKVELNGDGSLIMNWKCANPVGAQGTTYQVYRQIGGAGDFTFLGGVGAKKFTDATIPAGATFLTYKIQAVRSTAVGMWATFNVQFGTNAGGMMTASVTSSAQQQSPKLAA